MGKTLRRAKPKPPDAVRYAFILLALAALAGCVSRTTMFHNSDGSRTVVCRGGGFWWVPGTTAHSDYRACREAQEKSGYIEGPLTIRPALPAPVPYPGPS